MDPNIQKIVQSLTKRGLVKEADFLQSLLAPQQEEEKSKEKIAFCPICGEDPEPDCVLCDGSGILSSIMDDDEEDLRVIKQLGIP